jgi:hypothetical protein
MISDYSAFLQDIQNFLNFSNLNEKFDSGIKDFNVFIDKYKEIINEDSKKPAFVQISKNKNVKAYKYIKFNRENDDFVKKSWSINNQIKDNEKVILFIKSNLNKISDENYNIISQEFIDELLNLDYDESIFEILSNEIITKCIYDNKYRKVYINLCSKIWGNKKFHYQLYDIIDENDGRDNSEDDKNMDINIYCINKLTKERSESFSNDGDIKKYILRKSNFKNYFMNYIQQIFLKSDLSFVNDNGLSETDFLKKKKEYLVIIDIIGVLFYENHIHIDILNIIIMYLLHINNNFDKITDIEYEAFYNLIKNIEKIGINKKNYSKFYTEVINIIEQIKDSEKLSKRVLFFLDEIMININKTFLSENNLEKVCVVSISDNKNTFIENFKKRNFRTCKNIFRKLDLELDENKNLFYDLFIYLLEKKELVVSSLNELDNGGDYMKSDMKNIISNFSDLSLDISNLKERLLNLIEKLNLDGKEELLEQVKNIVDDDDDDDDESEDDETSSESSAI